MFVTVHLQTQCHTQYTMCYGQPVFQLLHTEHHLLIRYYYQAECLTRHMPHCASYCFTFYNNMT